MVSLSTPSKDDDFILVTSRRKKVSPISDISSNSSPIMPFNSKYSYSINRKTSAKETSRTNQLSQYSPSENISSSNESNTTKRYNSKVSFEARAKNQQKSGTKGNNAKTNPSMLQDHTKNSKSRRTSSKSIYKPGSTDFHKNLDFEHSTSNNSLLQQQRYNPTVILPNSSPVSLSTTTVGNTSDSTKMHPTLNLSAYSIWLENKNCIPVNVPGDGNCLFHALIASIPTIAAENHLELRHSIIGVMQNTESFKEGFTNTYHTSINSINEPIFRKDNSGNYILPFINKDYATYIEYMRKSGSYADSIMVQAASQFLNRNLEIFTGQGATISFKCSDKDTQTFPTTYLAWDNNLHFYGSKVSSTDFQNNSDLSSTDTQDNLEFLPSTTVEILLIPISNSIKVKSMRNIYNFYSESIIKSLDYWFRRGWKFHGFAKKLAEAFQLKNSNSTAILNKLEGFQLLKSEFTNKDTLTLFSKTRDHQTVINTIFENAFNITRAIQPDEPLNLFVNAREENTNQSLLQNLNMDNIHQQRPIRKINKNKHHLWINSLKPTLMSLLESIGKENEAQITEEFFNLPNNIFNKTIKPSSFSNDKDDEAMIHRTIKLVNSGNISKAMKFLENSTEGIQPVLDIGMNQQIINLHPASTVENVIPSVSDIHIGNTAGIEMDLISEEILQSVLKKFNKNSANAFSAWTYELVALSIHIDDSLLELFLKLINIIASGTIVCRDLWNLTRILAIPKDSSGLKLRPIAITEVFARITEKCLERITYSKVKDVLEPLQFGVRVSCGTEIIIHSMQLFYERMGNDEVLLSIDCNNAFNSIFRKSILNSINKFSPDLRNWFLWSYDINSKLYDSNGVFVCFSQEGVKQGGPLSSLLFALCVSDALKEAKEAYPDCNILSFLDDIFVFGKSDEVQHVFNSLKVSLGKLGLTINTHKCNMLSKPNNPFSFNDVTINHVKMNVLGSIIGSSNSIKEFAQQCSKQSLRVRDILVKFPAREGFLLLKYSINNRIRHLGRTIKLDNISETNINFDDDVDNILRHYIDLDNYDGDISTIRHLPTSMGGLGLSSMFITSQYAYQASISFVLRYLEQCLPSFFSLINLCDTVRTFRVDNPSSQSELMKVKNQSLYDDFLSNLSNEYTKALFMGFTGKHISAWMCSGLTDNDHYRLSNEDFVENIRLRLLIPCFIYNAPTMCEDCGCYIANNPFHALTCKGNANWKTGRHNIIRDTFHETLKVCKPQSLILKEQSVGLLSNGTNRRTDIVIQDGVKFQHVDVTIYCPTSESAIAHGSSRRNLATADLAEKNKIKTYAAVSTNVSNALIPFSIESTGSLGRSACKFIKALKAPKESPFIVKYFMMNVQRTLAKAQASMMRDSRNKGAVFSFY